MFRIGTTSYIYPDDILPNVKKLAGQVQDVELVLFEVDAYGSNLPTPAVVAELKAVARDKDLTYTVHLPLDLDFSSPPAFEKIVRALDATRALDPFAYVLHLDGRRLEGATPSPSTVADWQRAMDAALDRVLEHVSASQLCIENLETWSPDHFAGIVASKSLARCVDVGHFWKQHLDPLPHLREHMARTRIVHMHGMAERDHKSLAKQPRADVERVVDFLVDARFKGVLTLEVFGEDDFVSSMQTLHEVMAKWANA